MLAADPEESLLVAGAAAWLPGCLAAGGCWLGKTELALESGDILASKTSCFTMLELQQRRVLRRF